MMTNKEVIFWLNQIKDRYIHGGDEQFDANRKEAIDLAVKALETQQGEWKPIDAFVVKCSVCGVESFATPFCPRCGADMRGVKKNEISSCQ